MAREGTDPLILRRGTQRQMSDETHIPVVISGFRLEVDENCALLGYYAASRGNSLPKRQVVIYSAERPLA